MDLETTLTPRPDPTVLTTAQLTREIANARELIESKVNGATSLITSRLDARDRETERERATADRHVDTAVADLKTVIDTRLLALDRSIVLNTEQGRHWIEKLQVLLEEKIESAEDKTANLDRVVQTRLAGSETALNAAMAAADKVTQEIKLNIGAVLNELKAGVTKQIESLNEKVEDLKKRVFESGGREDGAGGRTSIIIATVAAIGTAISALIAITSLVVVLSRPAPPQAPVVYAQPGGVLPADPARPMHQSFPLAPSF